MKKPYDNIFYFDNIRGELEWIEKTIVDGYVTLAEYHIPYESIENEYYEYCRLTHKSQQEFFDYIRDKSTKTYSMIEGTLDYKLKQTLIFRTKPHALGLSEKTISAIIKASVTQSISDNRKYLNLNSNDITRMVNKRDFNIVTYHTNPYKKFYKDILLNLKEDCIVSDSEISYNFIWETPNKVVAFVNTKFNKVSFIDFNGTGIIFLNCEFTDCKFSTSNLYGTRFLNCHVNDDLIFHGCIMSNSQIRGTDIAKKLLLSSCEISNLSIDATKIDSSSITNCFSNKPIKGLDFSPTEITAR